jgi:hypothetical protein
MSFSYGWRGPNIVKDGLVLYLDPGSPNSYYNKTSTTIKDISGNGNNGTLINGPTYTTNNGGGISFDATDDYISINPINSSTQVTLNFWFKVTSTPSDYVGLINKFNGVNTQRNRLLIQPNMLRMLFEVIIGGVTYSISSDSFSNILNQNTMVTVTWDGSYVLMYINGSSVMSTPYPLSGTLNNGTQNPTIGWGADSSAYWFNGNIYNVLIYNRGLSAIEVLQNYNATKSKFGL